MQNLQWDMFASETKDRDWQKICQENNYGHIVVWLHASWCKPCCKIENEVNKLVTTNSSIGWFDIQVPKDNFEKEELKEVWGFETIPVFFVFTLKSKTWEKMNWDSFKQCALFVN